MTLAHVLVRWQQDKNDKESIFMARKPLYTFESKTLLLIRSKALVVRSDDAWLAQTSDGVYKCTSVRSHKWCTQMKLGYFISDWPLNLFMKIHAQTISLIFFHVWKFVVKSFKYLKIFHLQFWYRKFSMSNI